MEHLTQIENAYEAGDYAQALALLEQVFHTNGTQPRYLHLRALIYFQQEQYPESIAQFDELIAQAPPQADYHSDRGVALIRWGKGNEAIADFERALELEPHNGYRYACRAFIRSKVGDIKGAIADYEKALELDPQDEISRNNLEMAQEQLQYVEARPPRFKTKAHFSDAEIEKYKTAYDRRQQAKQLPKWKQYWKVVQAVFTSKHVFADFWRFLRKGFKAF